MHTNELDSLPAKVRRGLIGGRQAAMKVMETVYTNPRRFNLQDMDEDDRSEFLIDMIPKFESLIVRHDETKSPFGAYLYYSLPGLRKTWSRRRNDDQRGERAMSPAVKDIYEYSREKTRERHLRVAMPASIAQRARTPFVSKEQMLQRRSALVLALKSAWYIDDGHIDKISDFCEWPKDDIAERVQTVRDSLIKRSEKRNDLVKKRDKAWYFVCKYREQLSHMDKDTEAYQQQKRKLKYQLSSWKNKNSQLQMPNQRICPDNSTVAKALNLDPHKITTYINYAKQIASVANDKESMI